MVYHVGMYPKQGDVAIFNNFDTSFIYSFAYPVEPDDIDLVDLMFENILSNIDGKLGCVCICLSNMYDNDIRVKFVQSGKKYGFEKVELIDERMADYLMAVSQTPYKPKNDDIIWIFNNDGCHIWKKEEEKARYIISTEARDIHKSVLEEIFEISNLQKFPDAIIILENICYPEEDERVVSEMYPNCKFFTFSYENYAKAALKKAEIMAGYSDVAVYDAKTIFDGHLSINIPNGEFLNIQWQNSLPFTEFIKMNMINAKNNNNQNFNESLLLVTIDTNGIYSIRCIELSNKVDENLYYQVTKTKIEKLNLSNLNFEANCFDIRKKYILPKQISLADRKTDVVGIDLGTSRCCAAINRSNGIETIALDNIGERQLPSYVAFDERNPKCGQIVVNRLRHHAKSTVFDAKRIIGKKYEEIKIDKSWCYELCSLNIAEMEQINGKSKDFETLESDSCLIKLQTFEGESLKYPEEISAVLLKHIKQKSEDFQGKLLSEVVITVPAAFTESQRTATHNAALIAGWKKIHLLPEPIAASFAYFIDRTIPANFTFLLFDLGGGTLDVCIFKISNSKIQIISRSGDSDLGGRDFDNVLIKFFEQKLFEIYGISVPDDKKYKLMLQCQKIKENLSEVEKEDFDVQEIQSDTEKYIPITRENFEELSSNLLKKIKKIIKSASTSNQIDKVLQVGGGCRMPMIKNLLNEMFKSSEICCEQNPDEVVAIGAAYYGYYMNLIVNNEKFDEDTKKCSVM